MDKLSIDKIVELISKGKTFEAQSLDGSFSIKINRYVPYICTAIHDGSKIRKSIKEKFNHDKYEQWYEEDPHTGEFIQSLPITLIGNDSRFEYDLNRSPETCIHDVAWGKKVWKKKLTVKEKNESVLKHRGFYKVLKSLVSKLEAKYNSCVVYDLHSYNYKRWDREVPVFNVGTETIDRKKYGKVIDQWLLDLKEVELTQVETVVAENDVFFGRGYNCEFINSNFQNTLVLPTEIKKIYCNEDSGEIYPEVIQEVQSGLKEAIINNALLFTQIHTTWNSKAAFNLLDKKIDPALPKVDGQLYKSLKNFELLAYVNPQNNLSEQKKFLSRKTVVAPSFRYSPIRIDPYELKRVLSGINTKDISDVNIRHMYEDVINSFFDKTDLLSSLDSKKFLYNSLRYFGRPSSTDISNAEYILHLPSLPNEPKITPFIPIETVVDQFKRALDSYKMSCKIELSSKVISQVMVLNSQKRIRIRPDAKFTQKEVNALIEHELGVHMVTTQNSANQQLKIFNLGHPVNTKTQEGLAILAEVLSGNMTLRRLKKLALRVIVVEMMCSGATFEECYLYLINDQDTGRNDAYTIVTRVFRGGGFTKDYLYLSGFVKIMKMFKNGTDLSPLLVGKTSVEYYDILQEMIERDMVSAPGLITKSIDSPVSSIGEIYSYIISGLK